MINIAEPTPCKVNCFQSEIKFVVANITFIKQSMASPGGYSWGNCPFGFQIRRTTA